MRNADIRRRLLISLGAGSLAIGGVFACGGTNDTTSGVVDAGGDGAAGGDGSHTDSTSNDVAVEAAGDTGMAPDAEDAAEAAQGDAEGPQDAAMDGLPSVRRPFLVGSSLRAAERAARGDWSRLLPPAPGLDATTRGMLHRAWLDDALQEHASVAAFARLTMLMLAAGAPPRLIAASQRASIDEIRHAEGCFSLARRYGGAACGPGVLEVADSLSAMSLRELAALAAEEGCVGETLGVVLLREQLALARDPAVRATLARTLADEMRHAELSWAFARWLVEKGGDEVRQAIHAAATAAVAQTRRMVVKHYDVDLEAWHAHGRLTCAEARACAERGIREILLPCLEVLAASTPAAATPLAPRPARTA